MYWYIVPVAVNVANASKIGKNRKKEKMIIEITWHHYGQGGYEGHTQADINHNWKLGQWRL